jgi:hypothetical protein
MRFFSDEQKSQSSFFHGIPRSTCDKSGKDTKGHKNCHKMSPQLTSYSLDSLYHFKELSAVPNLGYAYPRK